MPKKLSILFTLAFLASSIFLLSSAYSQEIDVNDIENIDVDKLTNEQVAKLSEEIDKRGLTMQQLEVIAASRGISSLQIAKLKQRLISVKTSGTNQSDKGIVRLRENVVESGQNDPQFDIFDAIQSSQASLKNEDEIYGYNFFRNVNQGFEPSLNVPTPKNYILGAGDEVIIDVWGNSENTYQASVSPDGSIVIPDLGPIYLAGITIENADRRIKKRLKSIYSDLGSQTFAKVSLGTIRTIKVNIIGELDNPGSYTVSSFSTLINALYFAGGPNHLGSFREIDIYRQGKLFNKVDLYKFFTGEITTLPTLQDQDLVIIRPYVGRVKISGEVKRPGGYEIKANESLGRLLELCGGFNDVAYQGSISVRRNNRNDKSIITVTQEEVPEFQLRGGDEIFITKITSLFKNRVQIEGSVKNPGEYELTENLTLKGLIARAEGLQNDAFLGRAIIIRLNPDLSLSTIAVNLNDVLKGDNPIILQNEDYIKIASNFKLREEYTVSIQGEVNSPGKFQYLDSMTVEDLIFIAEGFKESAVTSFVEVARKVDGDSGNESKSSEIFNFQISEDLSLSDKSSTFYLEPFDLVIVRKSPKFSYQQIVEVEGEVYFAGKFSIEKKDERISDLLERAGGITKFAYLQGATLIRQTEYFGKREEDATAAKFKRENLQGISRRDSTLTAADLEIKRQESVGIDLESIIRNPGSKYDLILRNGDVLSIPKQLQTVRLRGELLHPSTVRYDKSLSFQDYVSQAGGFQNRANKGKSYIIYANGGVSTTKRFLWFKNYPKVAPGAEIIVPKKLERQPIGPQAWFAIASSTATIALAIQNLIN
ncbi:MAG: SLBB domain-containing protein [bacterium]|nr:SLBB domain-containing protein [bacterium]